MNHKPELFAVAHLAEDGSIVIQSYKLEDFRRFLALSYQERVNSTLGFQTMFETVSDQPECALEAITGKEPLYWCQGAGDGVINGFGADARQAFDSLWSHQRASTLTH